MVLYVWPSRSSVKVPYLQLSTFAVLQAVTPASELEETAELLDCVLLLNLTVVVGNFGNGMLDSASALLLDFAFELLDLALELLLDFTFELLDNFP